MLTLEYDAEKREIKIGKAVYSSYQDFGNSKLASRNFADSVLSLNQLWVPGLYKCDLDSFDDELISKDAGCYLKQWNKWAGEQLGCSYSRFWKYFNGLQMKIWIAPVYHLIKHVAPWSKGRFHAYVIERVWEHKEILQQAYVDGLYNILPIIAKTGKTPQELKAQYKSIWKQLCRNSLHKNKLIADKFASYSSNSVTLPTTLLKYPSEVVGGEMSMRYLANNFKGQWNKRRKMKDEARFFLDTDGLAYRLGLGEYYVNPSWSPRRLKEEHDKLAQEINAAKYSTEKLKCLDSIEPKVFQYEGYVATLLDSKFKIAEEGTAMGHCVGYYADHVAEGQYLVYSVTKDGERTSTLGINRSKTATIYATPPFRIEEDNKTEKFVFQQHYGRFNKPVTDAAEKTLPSLLIDHLNKQHEAITA